MANSHFSEKKWKSVSIGLMAVLATGFIFPQAFAHVTSNMQHGMEHVIALLNAIKVKTDNLPSDPASNTAVNTRASQQSVDEISTKLGQVPGRVITFNNLQIDLEENERHRIILEDHAFGHGIYADLEASGIDEDEGLTLLCIDDKDTVSAGRPVFNGLNHIDLACSGLYFGTSAIVGNAPVTATINGEIRYTNEYLGHHDEFASP